MKKNLICRKCGDYADPNFPIVFGDDPESLLTEWKDAYELLPEPYKADSCLFFWSEGGMLFCRPKDDEVQALGSWVCYFNDSSDGPGHPPYGWVTLIGPAVD